MNTINELLNRYEALSNDIKKYIMSNKEWIYYFLNPSASIKSNEELFNIIKEYPNNWEDIIDIKIKSISSGYVIVYLIADEDYCDIHIDLERTIILSTFETVVKRNKMICDGELNKIKINSLKKEIDALKNALKEKEEDLKKLNEECKN